MLSHKIIPRRVMFSSFEKAPWKSTENLKFSKTPIWIKLTDIPNLFQIVQKRGFARKFYKNTIFFKNKSTGLIGVKKGDFYKKRKYAGNTKRCREIKGKCIKRVFNRGYFGFQKRFLIIGLGYQTSKTLFFFVFFIKS